MRKNYNETSTMFPFLLPIRCILFLVFFFFISILSKTSYIDLSKYWTLIAILCNFITIVILYIYSYKKELTYQTLIHYEKGKTKVPLTILIVFLIIFIGMFGLYLAGLICYNSFPYLDKTMIQPIPIWLAILVLLLLPLSTTIAEDGLYLGYAINNSTGNAVVRPMLSAFFYAFQHSFIPFIPDGKFIIYRFLSFFPLTILICFWYKKTRNPLPFMIGHFILNIATAVQILLMTLNPEIFNSL